MDINLSIKTIESLDTINSFVELLATCPVRIPWKQGDNVQIDLTGTCKIMSWAKRSIIGFLMSTPSDYYRVMNPEPNHWKKQIKSDPVPNESTEKLKEE